MGNYFSSWFQAPEHVKDGVKRVNDSVFQLYKPPSGQRVEVDVIFFHGLQLGDYRNAYWDTWSSDKGATAWPRTLLAEGTLPGARIMSVSYDSAIRKSNKGGRADLFSIAENLVSDIIESDVFEDSSQRPLILVGHSLGGLVIKKFLLMACEMKCDLDENLPPDSTDAKRIARLENFIKNVRGVFYYSTPHLGSELADIADTIPGNSEVLNFLKTLGNETARLNDRFTKWRSKNDINVFSIFETLPTVRWGASFVVVKDPSGRQDSNECYSITADHINVCKPKDTTTASFAKLKRFITDNAERDGQTTLTLNLQ